MNSAKLFDRGIASGEAFCNRVEELDRLVKNIHKGTHSLLISPRRYGKTSLALRTLEKTELPFAYIDLFMKYDSESITHEFFVSLGTLISKIIKPTEIAIRKVQSVLKNISVSMTLGNLGLEFNFSPKTANDKKNIKSILLGIDEILAKNEKKVIIFIDEIQSISDSPLCDEIESTLRFVAQKTKNIVFVFSGSSRRLLGRIFDDRSRPLYKLCHRMEIERISSDHYKIFINKFAKIKWKAILSDDVLNKIFHHTKLHPYYMNILCGYLFEFDMLPTEENVTDYWKKICKEEQSSIAKDIEFLTAKQKKLLQEIAKDPSLKEPSGKEFIKKVDFSPRGILTAIQVLLKHDLLEKLENGEYRIIDPVLEYWLCL